MKVSSFWTFKKKVEIRTYKFIFKFDKYIDTEKMYDYIKIFMGTLT